MVDLKKRQIKNMQENETDKAVLISIWQYTCR